MHFYAIVLEMNMTYLVVLLYKYYLNIESKTYNMSGHAHVVYGPRILNEPKASGCTDILYNIVEANAADCCRLYSQDLT